MEKKKSIYEKPEALIVRLTLYTPIAQRTPGWNELNAATNGGTQLGRENRGSFFDEDEADDGGYKKFQLWDSADNN